MFGSSSSFSPIPLADRLVERVARHAPQEGRHSSLWPGLTFFRASQPSPRFPVIYESSLCFVVQGSKRLYLADRVYTYDPDHYLVLTVPLPAEAEIVQASAEEPFLSLVLQIDAAEVTDLLLTFPQGSPAAWREPAGPGVSVSAACPALARAIGRLLEALDDPMDTRVLAPLAVREILYHALTGEQGGHLRALAFGDSHGHRIAQVLRHLRAHYEEPLTIAALAQVARMSPSALHHAFKAVTAASPLQYLKQIRLHHARLLMLDGGLNAAEVAHRVGYGSASQFSREFKRLFGVPPTWTARVAEGGG